VDFLIDEDVPSSAAELLTELGHNVTYAVDVLLRGSDDYLLARWAHEHHATIVTCNSRHFHRLLVRPTYAHAGLIGLVQAPARERLEQCMPVIEREHQQRNRVRVDIRARTLFFRQ